MFDFLETFETGKGVETPDGRKLIQLKTFSWETQSGDWVTFALCIPQERASDKVHTPVVVEVGRRPAGKTAQPEQKVGSSNE